MGRGRSKGNDEIQAHELTNEGQNPNTRLRMKGFRFYMGEVEHFGEFDGDGTIVRINRHEVAHVSPPFLANFGFGDCLPLGFVFKLDVGEELASLGVEEDGVGFYSVVEERFFQVRPDRADFLGSTSGGYFR